MANNLDKNWVEELCIECSHEEDGKETKHVVENWRIS